MKNYLITSNDRSPEMSDPHNPSIKVFEGTVDTNEELARKVYDLVKSNSPYYSDVSLYEIEVKKTSKIIEKKYAYDGDRMFWEKMDKESEEKRQRQFDCV